MNYDTRQPGPYGGPIQPNYPRNTWWPAARASEITDQPYACEMLDTPVVIFRRSDGSLAALHDRCPHRWAPLSSGWVEDGQVVCGYHGLKFDASGQCTRVPTQKAIPPKAKVRSYLAVERYGMVWVWLGDPSLADKAYWPEELSFLTDPKWTVVTGHTPLEANYMMLKENVLDLTHFGYVHKNSIKVTDWTQPPKVEVGDLTVTYIQEFPNAPLSFIYGVPTGIGTERPVYRKNWGRFATAAINIGAVEIHDREAAPGTRDQFDFRVLHLTTPISPTRSRYWWFQGWDVALPPAFVEKWQPAVVTGYDEDKSILNSVQNTLSLDSAGTDYPEVLLQADQAAVQARRKLQSLLDLEREAS